LWSWSWHLILVFVTKILVMVLEFVVLAWVDPQAGAVSRIRRNIFVRQKSAEKVRLAEYYYRRKIPLHY